MRRLRRGRGQRAQPGLDLRAVRLQEGWQRQALTQVRWILVGGEAGAVRGDLEEHTARLAEVDRVEVEAVNHRRRAQPGVLEALAPGDLLLIVRRAEGDVMNPADADTPARQVWPLLQMHLGAQAAGAGLVDAHAALRPSLIRRKRVVAGGAEAHRLREDVHGGLWPHRDQPYGMQAANLILGGNGAAGPGHAAG